MGDWAGPTETERFSELKDQARADLAYGKSQSLEQAAAYYRVQAEDKSLPKADRDLWLFLANQMDSRLGRNAPPSKQEELF